MYSLYKLSAPPTKINTQRLPNIVKDKEAPKNKGTLFQFLNLLQSDIIVYEE